jgi:hypothetical protein
LLPTVLMIIAIALRLSPLPSSVAWWTFAASFASAMALPFLWFFVVLPRSMRDPGVLRRRLHAAGVWCFGGTVMVLVPALVFLAIATLRKSA